MHGIEVVTVREPGQHAGARADAAVTDRAGAVLGVWVGDCAPVALVAPSGVIGAAHAGWRGVAAGVLPATVAAMRRLGATGGRWPTSGRASRPECYEFGAADLDDLRQRFGATVVATTACGRAGARPGRRSCAASLAEVDVEVASSGPCTACDDRYWSHRGRGDLGRQAMAVWLEAELVMAVDVGLVGDRLVELRRRIAAAGGDDVTVVAVTKGFGPEAVEAAVAVGLDDIGENYAQELLAKLAGLGEDRPRVHFIGRLQSNKVPLAGRRRRPVAEHRPGVAGRAARQASGPPARVLVQVNVSDEPGKGGCAPGDVAALVARLREREARGRGSDGSRSHRAARVGATGLPPAARASSTISGSPTCSMGMTDDLEVAVEEGSTMVRVGSALFGPRPSTARTSELAWLRGGRDVRLQEGDVLPGARPRRRLRRRTARTRAAARARPAVEQRLRRARGVSSGTVRAIPARPQAQESVVTPAVAARAPTCRR